VPRFLRYFLDDRFFVVVAERRRPRPTLFRLFLAHLTPVFSDILCVPAGPAIGERGLLSPHGPQFLALPARFGPSTASVDGLPGIEAPGCGAT
jgi:hypothetical protein